MLRPVVIIALFAIISVLSDTLYPEEFQENEFFKRAPMGFGKRNDFYVPSEDYTPFLMVKRAPMRFGKRAPMRFGKRNQDI